MVSGLASSNHFLASHGSVIKRAATLASDSDASRSGPTEKPRGQRPRPASAPAPLCGAPPPGPPVTYRLRPFFARANQNQVEFVGPGGGLSPLRGLSGAELCPSGHIPLWGIQMTGQREEKPTSPFTDGSGHICLRPNSSAKIQSKFKRALPRPKRPAAPPRQQPRRAAFVRDRSRRSAPEQLTAS
jgi:hypothetical protein